MYQDEKGSSDAIIASWAADRLAMLDTLARYSWGYDEGDFEMLASIFTEDGSTSGRVAHSDIAWGPTSGNQNIADMLKEIRSQQDDQRRHTFHTHRFTNQTHNSADLHCYVILAASKAGETTVRATGKYHASMVKSDDGEWLIADLTALLDSPF